MAAAAAAPNVVELGSNCNGWEEVVAHRIRDTLQHRRAEQHGALDDDHKILVPFIVAIVGIPGSGKSTGSRLLAKLLEDQDIPAMILPQDGYHIPIHQLKLLPNATDLIYRRGAPETFDTLALKNDLQRIRSGINSDSEVSSLVHIPGFDHAKGDPEPNIHTFDRNRHQVVITEGLYLLHEDHGWESISQSDFFDLKIFLDASVDECMKRLKIRNLDIPGYTKEEIYIRVDKVDRVNAMTVMNSRDKADMVVPSFLSSPVTNKGLDNSLVEGGFMQQRQQQPADIHGASSDMVVTWERNMAKTIRDKVQSNSTRRPYIVGLVGMPGSGKSTSSIILANELQQLGLNCMIMPHDGYHFSMDYLRALADADDAIYRRGAPDTFDAEGLYRDLHLIQGNGKEGDKEVVQVPGFDHAKGDPELNKYTFNRQQHDLVICEGLYLLHDEGSWAGIQSLLDFSIYIDSDIEDCIRRIKVRNQCIPGYSIEEILRRAELVDRVNAMTVLKTKSRAHVIVQSFATIQNF